MQITVTFKLPIRLEKDGDWIVSHCDAFDIASQGRTEEEAKHNIIEALGLFLKGAYEMGTLEEVMKECGFSPVLAGEEEMPVAPGEELMDIPLPFMIKQTAHERCHA